MERVAFGDHDAFFALDGCHASRLDHPEFDEGLVLEGDLDLVGGAIRPEIGRDRSRKCDLGRMERRRHVDSLNVTDGSDPDVRTDLRLLDALHRGEEEAFAMLVTLHGDSVRRTVGRLLGFADLGVDDLVQDVFLAAWRGRRRLRSLDSAGAWLRGIAVRRCRSHVRRIVRRRTLARFVPLLEAAHVPGRSVSPGAASIDDGELAAALRALTHEHREVLVLTQLEGLTAGQAAAATGLTEAAVVSRLHRARTSLRDGLSAGAPVAASPSEHRLAPAEGAGR